MADRLLVDLASQSTDKFAQMGGFVGAHGNAVDLGESVGGPEGCLYAGESGAAPEEDAGVDPVPHWGACAASERAHAPHHAAAHSQRLNEGIRGVECSAADQQAGPDHEDGRLRRGRVDQLRQW